MDKIKKLNLLIIELLKCIKESKKSNYGHDWLWINDEEYSIFDLERMLERMIEKRNSKWYSLNTLVKELNTYIFDTGQGNLNPRMLVINKLNKEIVNQFQVSNDIKTAFEKIEKEIEMLKDEVFEKTNKLILGQGEK